MRVRVELDAPTPIAQKQPLHVLELPANVSAIPSTELRRNPSTDEHKRPVARWGLHDPPWMQHERNRHGLQLAADGAGTAPIRLARALRPTSGSRRRSDVRPLRTARRR
jgi:hypothetical protein